MKLISIIVIVSAVLLSSVAGTLAQSNDSFQNAQNLEGTYVERIDDLSAATRQLGEQDPENTGCFQRTLWYSWTAPQQGEVTLTTRSADGAVGIAAYIGDAWPQLYLIGYSYYRWSGDTAATFSFPVSAGQRIWIQLGSGSSRSIAEPINWSLFFGAKGSIVESLKLPAVATPENDDFAHAQPLSGSYVSAIAYALSATRGVFDPAAVGYYNYWYSWTPPSTGPVTLQLLCYNSVASLSLGVFTGDEVELLTQVALVTNRFSVGETAVSFQAIRGQRYFFSIGTTDSTRAPGPLILTVHAPADRVPIFSIAKAIALKIPTVEGNRYQLQTTSDLRNWLNINDSFIGNGLTMLQYCEIGQSDSTYYRVLVTPKP